MLPFGWGMMTMKKQKNVVMLLIYKQHPLLLDAHVSLSANSTYQGIQSQKPQSCEPVWIGPHAESCKNTLRLNYVEKPPTKKSTDSLPN